MQTRGDRHLHAVHLARQLAALGARLKTIHYVTGLPPRQVQSLFFPDANAIPRGRAPDSAEWYHGANLILRIDACIIGAKYHQLRSQGLLPGAALVAAYGAYQGATPPPQRISLDRAFNLISYIEGIWLARAPTLVVLTCPDCGTEFLAAIGTVVHAGEHCPFCRLQARFAIDPRIQASYPTRLARERTAPLLEVLSRLHWPLHPADPETPMQ